VNVAILYNEPTAGAGADEADVLVQVDAVAAALAVLGHHVERVACGLDLQAIVERLAMLTPDVVFNLAEGLAGHDRLYAVVPSLLDALRIPYTGAPAEAVFTTTNKLLGKERLLAAGIPTPALPAVWPQTASQPTTSEDDALAIGGRPPAFAPGRHILKPVWEHGSVGMEDSAVVDVRTREELLERLAAMGERSGRACFAEAFVDGRELNLSLLAGDDGVVVLPPAEIDFSAFPAGKPRIVGYAAKWDEGSFEYHHTPRHFDFAAAEQPLLDRVADLARACWHLFDLDGYARVDFRVGTDGRPWVLEVNANPCISPDAGFAAAIAQAGLRYEDAIARVLAAALRRARHATAAAVR
jgi:D-alanine-D-alanine ligase